MCKALNRCFHLGFGLLLLWLLFQSVVGWQHNGAAALAAGLVLACGLLALLHAAAPWVDGLSPGRFRLGLGLAALAYLALLVLLGTLLTQVLIMDMAKVYETLPDFLDGLPLSGDTAGYYMVCNNNLGLALVLTGFYRLAGMAGITPDAGAGIAAGVLFNCFMIWVAVLLLCRAVGLAGGRGSLQLLTLLCAALFAPYYLYAPQFYSDTICLPFLSLSLVWYLHWRRDPARRVIYPALLGGAIFVGFAIKGSLAVLLPACILMMLLDGVDSVQHSLQAALAMVLTFAVLLGGYRLWQNSFLDWDSSESYRYPTELWFCYGSHDLGDYSQQDVLDADALPTQAERRQMLRQRIWDNYTSRTLEENLEFFNNKAVRTWGSGTYDAEEFTAAPAHSNWTALFTVPGQRFYMPLVYYCQAWQCALLLLTGLGSLLALRQPWPDGAALARMTLLGLMLFLSLWETKARYALQATPCLLLCAVFALGLLHDLAAGHRGARLVLEKE